MEEKLFFKNSKGDKICAIVSTPSGDKNLPMVILCHGLATSKNSGTYVGITKLLNEENISTFRLDFYGHGESEGNFEDITVSEATDDILNAIAFLKSEGYQKIGLMGGSFGGIACILAAAQTAGLLVLALKSPVIDYLGKFLEQKTKEELETWKKQGYIFKKRWDGRKLKLNYSLFEDVEKIDGYGAVKKIKIPTIIVHGDRDESIPIEQSQKTAELMENCKLVVMPGADHSYSNPDDKAKVLRILAEFIIEKSK